MGGTCYLDFCINLLRFLTSWGFLATSQAQCWWVLSAQYLVQNPLSAHVPVGTATLCLANSALTTAGRLHSSRLPALKLSTTRLSPRDAPAAKGPGSDIRSQQGTALSASLEPAPAAPMLNTVLSGEWKSWKQKKRWWQHGMLAPKREFIHVDFAQNTLK